MDDAAVKKLFPILTIGKLRATLDKLPRKEDDLPVEIWLPGSRIYLVGTPFIHKSWRVLLIEGNVKKGSALYQALAGEEEDF